ncbi:splicing factor 3B subunit 1 [Trichoplax adhaerens]|uniref:Splicing factor 3B subunit 1 n=1 Tax=Trichoplax adhaerens TaxID=10228 RepID=B3RQX5_TRIAD|nr:splicing factor 3B subunit 1 [Trichoplax adhaerens]EDV26242.1 splicing factor 3B subunit 1 [Trichoplax adhaerens]|eukprot:XP_002110238.1 splicing factor 3B subunit 1 [Trichoplax adhaerens]
MASVGDIEKQIEDLQRNRSNLNEKEEKVGLGSKGHFDKDIYGDSSTKTGYVTSLPLNEAEEDEDDYSVSNTLNKRATYSAPQALLNDVPMQDKDYDPLAEYRHSRVADRDDEYRARRRNLIISPERHDPFADGGKTPDPKARTYIDIMQEQGLKKEEAEIIKKIHDNQETAPGAQVNGSAKAEKRKRRWDQPATETTPTAKKTSWEQAETPSVSRWDETPARSKGGETPSVRVWDATPTHTAPGAATPGSVSARKRNRWDETPKADQVTGETPGHGSSAWAETPGIDRSSGEPIGDTPSAKRRSRWDETPVNQMGGATPVFNSGVTPSGTAAMAMPTPSPANLVAMTPEQMQAFRWEKELDERNRPLSDDELNGLFPKEGYKVVAPPAGYQPIRTPARKLLATPTPMGGASTGFFMQDEKTSGSSKVVEDLQPAGNLPYLKPDDVQYFGKLLTEIDENLLSPEEAKERKIMKLLLKIKNGTPPMRKAALRQITDKSREFGAGPLFNQILPLLMSPTLEDQAAGLATMISTMRPDIDNIDEYVRNTTARAFAVVASALGIPSLLPFLKAVCRSKKSWQARHTGIKIVQQISILMGCAILPHLRSLVEIIEHGLVDEQQKVRTITALALAALAESATPYGIESFDSVLKPLWKGIRNHRGKGLAAFLKAIGYIIPLMDAEFANYYTREVMIILIREFQSPDEEMKKIVLKVVKQCCSTDGVEPQYIKEQILPPFFKHFWNQRMALDRRNYRQLVDTTVEIANAVGAAEIISRVVDDLKDESEQYRKMVMEAIDKIMANLGAADIDSRLEEQLIDGILYAFQEQTQEDAVMLNGFGTVVNSLGTRVKAYLPQICGTVLWRMNNKSAKVRQQAADLISRIAVIMKTCGEEKLMNHLGVVLYEYLGEEYPEVLGSILAALKAIVNVIGMNKMTPPIKDLLPRLTPILKNRHEKVQENCIDLVGRIADRGAEFVSAREWMRICFELLELLKAHKKAIRRATVNTFGYIAKAIGPQDVLATLLNNLKVQERQNRVCTTVAIAIVAETCSPFTVLPALMNEYRVPELNVQNGVLKSLSFLFEYIGEMGKDYIYAVTPLLEDALMDRDLVHRQTASSVVKHMSLGVVGFGCEDALTHLLNYVWPNIFETSPHVINAVMEAIDGLRVGIGPTKVLQYTLQGLFHPARRVREVYWKIYNNLYIGSQDALIGSYPRVENEEKNSYYRYFLDYTL